MNNGLRLNDKWMRNPCFAVQKVKKKKQKQCLAFFRILKNHCFACSKLQKINLLRLQNPKNKMRFQIAKNDVISWFSMLFDSKNIVFFNDICFALAAYEKKQKHLSKSSKNSCFWFSKPRKMNFSCFLKSLKKNIFFEFATGPLKKKKKTCSAI